MRGSDLESAPLFSEASRSLFTPIRRRKINCIAIFLNVFVPWIFFTFLYYLISFKMHYVYPIRVWIVFGLVTAAAVCTAGGLARAENKGYTPQWFKFATLQFIIAAAAAALMGSYNFWFNTMPFYDWERLKTYPSLDPSKELGQNMMDAGTVYFPEGTSIDLTQSWHFMSDKVYHGIHRYCVAPIILGGAPATGSYDFWAVGMDCCSASSSDFRCGQFASGNTRSGLRLLDDLARPYYKLAVKQAEAQYHYKSKHPIFFEWVRDPLARVQQFMDKGLEYYLFGVMAAFTFNVCSVAFATFFFSFIGR